MGALGSWEYWEKEHQEVGASRVPRGLEEPGYWDYWGREHRGTGIVRYQGWRHQNTRDKANGGV